MGQTTSTQRPVNTRPFFSGYPLAFHASLEQRVRVTYYMIHMHERTQHIPISPCRTCLVAPQANKRGSFFYTFREYFFSGAGMRWGYAFAVLYISEGKKIVQRTRRKKFGAAIVHWALREEVDIRSRHGTTYFRTHLFGASRAPPIDEALCFP